MASGNKPDSCAPRKALIISGFAGGFFFYPPAELPKVGGIREPGRVFRAAACIILWFCAAAGPTSCACKDRRTVI